MLMICIILNCTHKGVLKAVAKTIGYRDDNNIHSARCTRGFPFQSPTLPRLASLFVGASIMIEHPLLVSTSLRSWERPSAITDIDRANNG